MLELFATYLLYCVLWIILLAVWMFIQWRLDKHVIDSVLKDCTQSLEDCIKAKLELQKIKAEMKKITHNGMHHIVAQKLIHPDEESELLDKIKRYEKYVPKTEIYKKTIIEWKQAWKTSDWIGKQLNLSGSAIRKALRSWAV